MRTRSRPGCGRGGPRSVPSGVSVPGRPRRRSRSSRRSLRFFLPASIPPAARSPPPPRHVRPPGSAVRRGSCTGCDRRQSVNAGRRSPPDLRIWTPAAAGELDRLYVQRPYAGSGTFLERLLIQLVEAARAVQSRRHHSLIDSCFASAPIDISPRRASSATRRQNSGGCGAGMVDTCGSMKDASDETDRAYVDYALDSDGGRLRTLTP